MLPRGLPFFQVPARPKFINTRQLIEELTRETETPEYQSKMLDDIRAAEAMTVYPTTTTGTTEKKASFAFSVPNMATVPPRTTRIEACVAKIEGFGSHQINFETDFKEDPYCFTIPLGFFEIKIPWISISWREYGLLGKSIRLPVGIAVEMKSIRIPSMTFPMGATKDYVEVFHVFGIT